MMIVRLDEQARSYPAMKKFIKKGKLLKQTKCRRAKRYVNITAYYGKITHKGETK